MLPHRGQLQYASSPVSRLTETNVWGYGEERTWGYDEWSSDFAIRSQPSDAYDPQPGLHWIIVGGESGVHARPMFLAWAESLADQARSSDSIP